MKVMEEQFTSIIVDLIVKGPILPNVFPQNSGGGGIYIKKLFWFRKQHHT